MPLSITYCRGSNDFNTPDDYIDILYKDMDNGQKYVETIKNPMYEVWITKPEFRNYSHIRDFYPITQCNRYQVHYKTRHKEIADILGISPKHVKTSQYVFQLDMSIETFYLSQFMFEYGNDRPKKLSIGVLDIENDIVQCSGFPVYGEEPIDAVSFVTEDTKRCYLFLYTKDNLPHLPETHKNYQTLENIRKRFNDQMNHYRTHPEEVIKAMDDTFREVYGEFEYIPLFFDEEIDLINTLFQVIESEGIDFLGIWNAPYDAGNLYERPRYLGYDPASVICSKKFGGDVERHIEFREDRNFQAHKRKHVFKFNVPYVISDMMVNYAGIRAGRGKIPSLKLNAVARNELMDEKINYDEYGSMKWFKYQDLLKFWIYNAKDTILLLGMQRVTKDFNTLYQTMIDDIVSCSEAFTSTRMIENALRQFAFTYHCGYVMGSNKHKWETNGLIDYRKMAYSAFGINLEIDGGMSMDGITDEEANILYETISEKDMDEYNPNDFAIDVDEKDAKDKKFKGAFVMNPKHVKSTGTIINGVLSDTVHDDTVDEDITSEYPSGMQGMNAGNESLVAKVFVIMPLKFRLPEYDTFHYVDDKEEKENKTTDISSWIMEQYSTGDILNFGHTVFELPTATEVIAGFDTFLEEEI